MNTEEIMKLADAYAGTKYRFAHVPSKVYEARAALEAALSAKQGEQEPVATMTVREDMGADIKFHQALTLLPGQAFALYTHPAPSVNAQERISELEAQNAQLLELYSLLASAWFYGNWKAETKNERDMQAVMEREGYWPTTEEEILDRAAIAAVEGKV